MKINVSVENLNSTREKISQKAQLLIFELKSLNKAETEDDKVFHSTVNQHLVEMGFVNSKGEETVILHLVLEGQSCTFLPNVYQDFEIVLFIQPQLLFSLSR